MVLRFLILATAFLLACSTVERDNCYDEVSANYSGGGFCVNKHPHPTDSIGR
jgi:hypothetical protein